MRNGSVGRAFSLGLNGYWFETQWRSKCKVSLSNTLYPLKINPGRQTIVPTRLKDYLLGRKTSTQTNKA